MVASLEEAFGIKSFKKKKVCKKDFQKVGFTHYNNSNVYNKDKYFNDNTNINSNDVYQDREYYPRNRPMNRNKIPKILLEQSNDNPIRLANVPIEMGAGDEPSDGDYQYAPGSEAEKEYLNYSPEKQNTNNKEYLQYIEEQDADFIEEDNTNDYDSKETLIEGMVDYQTFERGVQRSIQDLTEKVNKLLNGNNVIQNSNDYLSNSADIVLYIFTGVFFLLLFDMAFKLGKMRR